MLPNVALRALQVARRRTKGGGGGLEDTPLIRLSYASSRAAINGIGLDHCCLPLLDELFRQSIGIGGVCSHLPVGEDSGISQGSHMPSLSWKPLFKKNAGPCLALRSLPRYINFKTCKKHF